MPEEEREERTKEVVLFHAPLTALRFAMALGATVTALSAVVMQVFGWFTDSSYWELKGLTGFAYAAIYFAAILLLKCLETDLTKERTKRSVEDLLNGEDFHVNRESVNTRRKNPQPKKRKGGK